MEEGWVGRGRNHRRASHDHCLLEEPSPHLSSTPDKWPRRGSIRHHGHQRLANDMSPLPTRAKLFRTQTHCTIYPLPHIPYEKICRITGTLRTREHYDLGRSKKED